MEKEKNPDFDISQNPDSAGRTEAGKASENLVPTADDYAGAALFLSRTYLAMKAEQENIRKWLSGEKVFTSDDALAELISITPQSDDGTGVRVQTSNTSDQTARIGMQLAGGYVEKRQRQIMQELCSPEMLCHTSYLDWKIDIVNTAVNERMTKLQAAIFTQIFVKGKSYSEMIRSYKNKWKPLQKRKINLEKNKALDAVACEIRAVSEEDQEMAYVAGLMREVGKEKMSS